LRGALAGSLWDRSPPVGSRGRALVGVWGLPSEASRVLRHEAEKQLMKRKTRLYRLTLYGNTIIIISSIHRFVSSHFSLKIQNVVSGLYSQGNGLPATASGI